MRISSVIASIVLVGGVLAQAPSGTNSASAASSGIGKDASAALAGIDQCFIDCATKGIGAAGCNGLMDASCYCLKQSFVDDVSPTITLLSDSLSPPPLLQMLTHFGFLPLRLASVSKRRARMSIKPSCLQVSRCSR